jgi:hypothetical protein
MDPRPSRTVCANSFPLKKKHLSTLSEESSGAMSSGGIRDVMQTPQSELRVRGTGTSSKSLP